ncbi:hypothetical protein SESBI_25902 [Sesbania bispinosa]|nr:hypothetical protein SESBI_25902 [Sesbania bispinosa]
MSVGPQSKNSSPSKPCFIIPVPVPSYTQKQKGREEKRERLEKEAEIRRVREELLQQQANQKDL